MSATVGGGRLILCLNTGSSSLKVALEEIASGGAERRVRAGAVEGIGLERGRIWLRDASGATLHDSNDPIPDHETAICAILDELLRGAPASVAAVGHRIVHGGTEHVAPERIDRVLLDDLRRLVALAPLHLPPAIEGIEASLRQLPSVPQVACFDTAFHHAMPEVAQRFPLPRRLFERGVRRYGFHGLSYEYAVRELGASRLGRAVLAHLGNGASLAAVRDGRSLDTTMGFSPAGGLMMGTRCGDLDPGALLHLIEGGLGTAELARLINDESGLRGVSDTSSDMRALIERRDRDPRAAQAIELFCHLLRKQIGAMAAVLGGIDSLVFMGGIGEHAAPIRAETCAGLEHLGVALDAERNRANDRIISRDDSRCIVRVLATDEERMIARHVAHLLLAGAP